MWVRILARFWGALWGAFWVTFGHPLGHLGTPLGSFSVTLGSLWDTLGPLWALFCHLGLTLAQLWHPWVPLEVDFIQILHLFDALGSEIDSGLKNYDFL